MKILKRSLLIFVSAVQILVLLAALVKPAHAYVDPGSGLLFFQMGGSMLAGALFVMRSKIRKLLGLKPKSNGISAESSEQAEARQTLRTGTRG